jgi:hypothetical protein
MRSAGAAVSLADLTEPTGGVPRMAADTGPSGNGVAEEFFDLEHVEENFRPLVVRYGAASFRVAYRPLIAGKRQFQREMNMLGEGYLPDELAEQERHDGEADATLADRLFMEGICKVLASWTIRHGGEVVPIRVETFREKWFVDDVLAVIWLEIINDLEPGKAARRRARSLRTEVGLGAGSPLTG